MWLYLHNNGDLPGKHLRVRRDVTQCLLCTSVKVTPVFDRLIYTSENVNIETIEVLHENDISFFPLVKLINFFLLFQYSCGYIAT